MKTSPPPSAGRFAIFLALAAFTSPAIASLVVNGDFAAGAPPWTLAVSTAAAATLSASEGEGRVTITNGGTSRSHIILQQTLSGPLAAGVTYVIAFDVRADSTKRFDVLVRAATSAVLGGFYGLVAGPAPAPVTVEYTHVGTDAADARLNFRLGADNTGVIIDNVTFAPKGEASRLLTRDSSGEWVFPQVEAGGRAWRADVFDFSYAGYRYGERDQPTDLSAAEITINAAEGENITALINAAVAGLPTGGTVRIPAGTYEIGSSAEPRTVTVNRDNIFLRGAGKGVTTLRVSADYHPPGDTFGSRREATYREGVINFVKGESYSWFYGPAGARALAPVALGAREITVDNPDAFAAGDTIVIRQIMWRDFVTAHAYDAADARPWRWTNYNTAGDPLFTDKKHSFAYQRRVLAVNGSTLRLDVPVPARLDPADAPVNVAPIHVEPLRNCGLLDLTLTAAPEAGASPAQDALGTTLMIRGLTDGLFRAVDIASFRSIAFATDYSVNVTFVECRAADALNCGDGGAGYGFYVKGQNLLFQRCTAERLRHGYTTASPQTSGVVFKDCRSRDYRFNTGLPPGEYVDDTHLGYSHGLLWDGHDSRRAGLLMMNRGRLSGSAFQTCGWAVVWNYRNEGLAPGYPGATTADYKTGHDCRENLLGLTPAEFGLVIGAHAGDGEAGLRVYDGYTRWPATSFGQRVTDPALHVAAQTGKVLYEHTGAAVAYSLYDALLASRAPLLAP